MSTNVAEMIKKKTIEGAGDDVVTVVVGETMMKTRVR